MFKILNDKEHFILRPQMYIGAVNPITDNTFIWDNGKIVMKKVSYVPGLIKIINEIIDNSLDEHIKAKSKNAYINITIKDNAITVKDNGRGIPVKKLEDGTYIPEACFCKARAGSNFENPNEKRNSLGMNGIGAFATAVFSKILHVETDDGNLKFILNTENNLDKIFHKIEKSSKIKGTTVYFIPDYEKFGIKSFDDVHYNIILQRLHALSVCYPFISFKLNDEEIVNKTPIQFMERFSDDFIFIKDDKRFVGVTLGDGVFTHYSIINGLFLKNGGSHVEYISDYIAGYVKNKLEKKYPNLKQKDIKNNLFLITLFKDFENSKFSSQTKETLTNTEKELLDYLKDFPLEKLADKVLKHQSFIDKMTEIYELKNKKEEEKLIKRKKIKSDKYYEAIESKKYFVITEGASACSNLLKALGRKEFGYFASKGKCGNVYNESVSSTLKFEEFKLVIDILNLKINNPDYSKMSYEKIIIATDADFDGIIIRGLWFTFFNKWFKELVDDKKVLILETPVVIAFKGSNIEHYYLSFKDYLQSKNTLPSNLIFKYYKGLGSHTKESLEALIKKIGLEALLRPFEKDQNWEYYWNLWMNDKESDLRKLEIKELIFDIERL